MTTKSENLTCPYYYTIHKPESPGGHIWEWDCCSLDSRACICDPDFPEDCEKLNDPVGYGLDPDPRPVEIMTRCGLETQ